MSRQGSAKIFFEIVGAFQVQRLVKDAKTAGVVMKAILLDSVGGVVEAFQATFEGINELVEEQIEAFREYEEQLIQVRKFYQGSEEAIASFAEAGRDLGETFAFSGAEALAAAANMAQMKTVLGEAEAVITGTEMGLLFAEIGNMETQMAMKRLTSLMQQTHFAMGGLTAETFRMLDAQEQANIVRGNTLRVLDQLNTIENSSVATMEDMTFVLNQFASQANLAGESMGDMASLAAMLLEAGEETSRAGTGLRMMYSRLAVDGGDAAVAVAEVVPGLDAQTVSTMSLTEVIERLVPHYEKMTDIEKVRLTQAIAGNRHYVKLQKLIENNVRLTQLQEMAYTGTYGAIDEFENRQESSLFAMERAEAILQNLRAEIGDNLAQAYIKAMNPQHKFLQGLKFMTDDASLVNQEFRLMGIEMENVSRNLIGATMHLSNLAEVAQVPIDMALGFANVGVAIATMRIIFNQHRDEMNQMHSFHTQSFARRVRDMEYQNSLALQSVKLNEAEIGVVMKLGRTREMAAMSAIGLNQRRINAEEKAIRFMIAGQGTLEKMKEKASAEEAKRLGIQQAKNNEIIKLYRKEIVSLREKQTALREIHQQEMMMNKQMIANKDNINAIMSRSNSLRLDQQSEMKVLASSIKRETRLLQDEFILTEALTEEQREGLDVAGREVRTNLQLETQRKNQLNTNKAHIISKGKLNDKDREAIAAIDAQTKEINENIAALGRQRVEIEQVTLADDHLKQSKDELTARQNANNISMAQSAQEMAKQAFNLKRLGMQTTGMLFMISMFAKDEEDRRAAVAATNAALLAQGAAMAAASAAAAGLGTATAIATGGISLLTSAAAAVAAMFVMKNTPMGDWLAGGDFAEEVAKIQVLDDSMTSFHAVMTDIANLGDDEFMGMGITYDNLRADANLAASTLDDVETQYNSLRDYIFTDMEAGTYTDQYLALTEAEQSMLDVRFGKLQRGYAELDAINHAHLVVQGAFNKDLERQFAITENTVEGMGDFSVRFNKQTGDIMEINSTSQIMKAVKVGDELIGIAAEGTSRYEELLTQAVARQTELIEGGELQAQISLDVANQLLAQLGGANNSISSSLDDQLRMIDEFANAREELFFGERANFTGAIFKQVQQGGVEKLLYNVELHQQNIFNGMTLPEMVEQVSAGVVEDLRRQGVPIRG
tara:strand:+ start:3371 stop:6889 length:3519 start_codon:yes stop_codon:yes gene_type:complete